MTGVNQVTDFLEAHLSYARYIHDVWFVDGHPPLWNSSALAGMPLVADPLSGYGYLPNWLVYLFPSALIYNILFFAHLAWTGIGLYLFLRCERRRPAAALFGAAAWMGTSKLIGYLGGGQVSSIFALAWFPWVLLVTSRLAKDLKPRTATLAAGVLAIIFLADVRWGFFAGLLALAFLASRIAYRKTGVWPIVKILAPLVAFGFLLTAMLSLPMVELMVHSDRSLLSAADRGIFSLDAGNLLAVLAPQFGIYYELMTYLGFPVLVLAFLGMRKSHWFWIALAGVGVLFSLGQNGPLFPFISNLVPGLDWLRVPSRAWFLVALACAILSAQGIDGLHDSIKQPAFRTRFRLVSFVLSLFAVLLALGVAILFPPLPEGIIAFAIMAPLTFLLLNIMVADNRPSWVILIFALTIANLLWVNSSIFGSAPIPPESEAVHWIEEQPGLFRVYSPSGSLSLPNTLQTAEGVNPLHLQVYRQFMEQTSGIRVPGYSVSVPGIYLTPRSDPALFETAAAPDFHALGLLNVKYVVTSFPLTSALIPVKVFDQVYVYENPDYRERAWVDGPGTVSISAWSPDRIVASVDLDAGGTVVFSEIDYPGWQATVDGQATPVDQVDQLLRGVAVSAGKHSIVLYYVPLLFYIGLGASILAWAGFLFTIRPYAVTLVARARSALS